MVIKERFHPEREDNQKQTNSGWETWLKMNYTDPLRVEHNKMWFMYGVFFFCIIYETKCGIWSIYGDLIWKRRFKHNSLAFSWCCIWAEYVSFLCLLPSQRWTPSTELTSHALSSLLSLFIAFHPFKATVSYAALAFHMREAECSTLQ